MVIPTGFILGPDNSISRNVSYRLTFVQKQNIVDNLNVNQYIPSMRKN